MENISERLTLEARETAAIENVPFEILEQIFSILPRNDRLAASRCCKKIRRFNEEFTWKTMHVDIGDSSEFTDRTERSKYLFENLPYLYTTLLNYRYLGEYTTKLSLKISRYRTYGMMIDMRFLRLFSSVQELSLSPPPFDLELPLKPTSLRLDFHYDRLAFWQSSCHGTPRLMLEQYFRMPHLRKLQVEHISFEPDMHHDSFAGPQRVSPIEDLRFVDCSPQTVGVLAKILLSVKSLKRLSLEMNIPRPVVETFNGNYSHWDWDRPGGQDYGRAIKPHAQSLEELMIAFSNGASFFIRPFHAAHPQTGILRMRPYIFGSPLVPRIESLDKFTNLKRLAIPESFLARSPDEMQFLPELLPKLLEEMQLQIPVSIIDQTVEFFGRKWLQMARMHALAADKGTYLPRLKLVICWYQQYDPTGRAELGGEAFLHSEGSWSGLRKAFGAVAVHLDRVSGPFFENTPFGQRLNISHCRLRPPHRIPQGPSTGAPVRPGLYFDLSTNSIF